MSSSYRPRRTRIYGANYDIGESYYKKQLQDLDYKRDPLSRQRRELSFDDSMLRTDRLTPKVSFTSPVEEKDDFFKKLPKPTEYRSAYIDNEDDDFLSKFKRKDEQFFKDDLFATKRASSMKKQRSPSPDDFDTKVSSALAKARNFKSKYLVEDDDAADGLIVPARKSKFRSLLDDNDFESNTATSALSSSAVSASSKRVSRFRKNIVDTEESVESAAASNRAARTKARLADLENEMEGLSFKQNEREKRSLNLKKLLRDSESVDVML